MLRLLNAWDPDWSVLIGCAALLAAYHWYRAELPRGLWFVAGVLVMLVALISPLDTLGDEYLLSAHMMQHLVLLLIVPVFLLLGVTPRVTNYVTRSRLAAVERRLRRPMVAWSLVTAAIVIWHISSLYDAALQNECIHIVEHLSFLIAATVFWWPILGADSEDRLAPIAAELYLLAAAMANSLVGIWITFASTPLYTPYLHPRDSLHIEILLREQWGLSPMIDQQIAGLLMWVGGGFVFLTVMIMLFLRWSEYDDDWTAPDQSLLKDSGYALK